MFRSPLALVAYDRPSADAESPEQTMRRRLQAATPSLLPLVEQLVQAVRHDVTVLLTGETGTGKTFLAQLLHDVSPRKGHRFLVIPCGALASGLIESELFGHVSGAFTGAAASRPGKLAAAGGGTLLLDEIDVLGLEQQARLLRVLENGEYEPVGSNHTQICAAHLIVTSNCDLEEAVARGRFRSDLYYRLQGFICHLPPLRERKADIAPLARGMAARFNAEFHKALCEISAEALEHLEAYAWPGNVRQLQNAVRQAVLMSAGPTLGPENLPDDVRAPRCPPALGECAPGGALQASRRDLERRMIEHALAANGSLREPTARALGVSRTWLYRHMKEHGLLDDGGRLPPARLRSRQPAKRVKE